MVDPLRIHQMEQGLAALSQVSGMVLAVLRGAKEAGATPEEARVLVTAYWAALLNPAREGGDE